MSTDTENTRVIVDAADKINEIIKRSDQRKQADLQQIRKDMHDAKLLADRHAFLRGVALDNMHSKRTWIDRFADWINGR